MIDLTVGGSGGGGNGEGGAGGKVGGDGDGGGGGGNPDDSSSSSSSSSDDDSDSDSDKILILNLPDGRGARPAATGERILSWELDADIAPVDTSLQTRLGPGSGPRRVSLAAVPPNFRLNDNNTG